MPRNYEIVSNPRNSLQISPHQLPIPSAQCLKKHPIDKLPLPREVVITITTTVPPTIAEEAGTHVVVVPRTTKTEEVTNLAEGDITIITAEEVVEAATCHHLNLLECHLVHSL